jgi:hypothetical protein
VVTVSDVFAVLVVLAEPLRRGRWPLRILKKDKSSGKKGCGIVLCSEMRHVLKAERVLKKFGYLAKLVAPPLNLRKGCDLAVEINLMEQTGIERKLSENEVEVLDIVALEGGSQKPLDVVKVTDFGDSIMVRSANMKITFNKENGEIVNISGGGCPDVPYLHIQMIDKKLSEAPRPRDLGYTLCALMLDKAYEESVNMFQLCF